MSGTKKLWLVGRRPPAVSSSVQKGNITLTFSTPVNTTTNFMGDVFIQGPATITAIDPSPTGTGTGRRNGAMINPSDYRKQGYDGRPTGNYDQSYSYAVGTEVQAGQSLVCSISRRPELTWAELTALENNPRCMGECEVFTFVSSLPAAGAEVFRPPYCGTDKTIIAKSTINYGLLPGLTAPFNPSSSFGLATDPKAGMSKLWLDHVGVGPPGSNINNYTSCVPDNHQQWYPAERSAALSRLAMYTMCNFADVQTYANRIVQYGIDLKAATLQANWGYAYGAGFGVGRALPLLYAGWLLGDTSFRDRVMTGSTVSPKFGEQVSYYYSTTPYSGYDFPPQFGGPSYPMYGDNVSDYGVNHSGRDPAGKYVACGSTIRYQRTDAGNTVMQSAGAYMQCCNPKSLGGAVLWGHLSGQIDYFNTQAMVDFMDWWTSDDLLALPNSVGLTDDKRDVYQFSGNGNLWMKQMWETYR